MSETFLLGGSFDPIHEGHLELARALLKRFNPEKILMIPAQQNPLKDTRPTPAEHRWAMVELALKELNERRVRGWKGELLRVGPSFTIDTLHKLSKLGEKNLVLVMGNEVYQHFSSWKDPEGIRAIARLLIVDRELKDAVPMAPGTDRFVFPALPYSATGLRRGIAALWKSGKVQVKPQGIGHSVWQYIKENRLYAVE